MTPFPARQRVIVAPALTVVGNPGEPLVRIAVVGSGIAGLGIRVPAAAAGSRGHACSRPPRGSAAIRTPSTSRSDGVTHPGRHRLPRVQRPHLSAPDRAVRRTRRGERAVGHVVLGAQRRAPASNGPAPVSRRCSRSRATRCAPRTGGCSPTSLRFNRETTRARARGECVWSVTLGEYLDAESLLGRRSATGTWCRWPPRSGRRRARDPRLPAADVRALLPQPRLAADRRPPALAHGAGGARELCRRDCRETCPTCASRRR